MRPLLLVAVLAGAGIVASAQTLIEARCWRQDPLIEQPTIVLLDAREANAVAYAQANGYPTAARAIWDAQAIMEYIGVDQWESDWDLQVEEGSFDSHSTLTVPLVDNPRITLICDVLDANDQLLVQYGGIREVLPYSYDYSRGIWQTLTSGIGTIVEWLANMPGAISDAIDDQIQLIVSAVGDVTGAVQSLLAQADAQVEGTLAYNINQWINDLAGNVYNVLAQLDADQPGTLAYRLSGWISDVGGAINNVLAQLDADTPGTLAYRLSGWVSDTIAAVQAIPETVLGYVWPDSEGWDGYRSRWQAVLAVYQQIISDVGGLVTDTGRLVWCLRPRVVEPLAIVSGDGISPEPGLLVTLPMSIYRTGSGTTISIVQAHVEGSHQPFVVTGPQWPLIPYGWRKVMTSGLDNPSLQDVSGNAETTARAKNKLWWNDYANLSHGITQGTAEGTRTYGGAIRERTWWLPIALVLLGVALAIYRSVVPREETVTP